MVLVSAAIMMDAMKLQTCDDLRHPIVLSGARRPAKSCWDTLYRRYLYRYGKGGKVMSF